MYLYFSFTYGLKMKDHYKNSEKKEKYLVDFLFQNYKKEKLEKEKLEKEK